MPALLERLLPSITVPVTPVNTPEDAALASPPPASNDNEERQAPAQKICSGCYLTEAELNRTGLLGCSRCYETFAAVIASAVEVLHGVRVPGEWAKPKPRHTVTNPWPTRRGVRLESP